MASRAFAAVARSVLYCLLDPEAEGEDQYLFGHAKSNLGPRQETIKYGLIEAKVAESITTSRVDWRGVDTRTIRDAMETARAVARPVGELAVELEAWIRDQGRTVTRAEVGAEFSDVKSATLDQNLKRMVDRRSLYRPTRGHFAITQGNDSDTVSDTSLETQEASEVSEVSEVLTELTELTSDTSPREVSETLQCCKGGVLLPRCKLCHDSPNYWRESA
jgi:hypothetical protein